MGHEFLINISSYDTNIMLAAIISLLVVILIVLLLHIYARWFFTSLIPTSSSTSQPFSYTFPTSTFHHNFHSSSNSSPSKGLDPSLVSSIPLFIYSKQQQQQQQKGVLEECVICLSVFEANEVGRRLKKCGHGFHVECIDMWLRSHLNCPICRAPAAVDSKEKDSELDQIVIVDVQNYENTNNDNSVVNYDSSSSSSSSMGCSLKRMLSRNRLEGYCNKVFPSVHNELGV